MDKQQQIEEIAQIINGSTELDTIAYYRCMNIAKILYNAGYRKPSEDSVVLTMKEWENLHTNYAKALYNVRQNAIKETAERDFYTIIKALEERKERVKAFYGIAESVGADIAIRTVKELAKQFGVEIKE